jgi:hypothetical protein
MPTKPTPSHLHCTHSILRSAPLYSASRCNPNQTQYNIMPTNRIPSHLHCTHSILRSAPLYSAKRCSVALPGVPLCMGPRRRVASRQQLSSRSLSATHPRREISCRRQKRLCADMQARCEVRCSKVQCSATPGEAGGKVAGMQDLSGAACWACPNAPKRGLQAQIG